MSEWGPEAGGAALTALAVAVLVLLAWTDLRTGRIPNAVVYPAVAGALILSAPWPGHAPASALLGAAGAGAAAAALRALSRGGLGGGDVKMAALVGASAGSADVVAAGLVAALAGGVAATVLLASGRAGPGARLPYGPFLAAGGITALLL